MALVLRSVEIGYPGSDEALDVLDGNCGHTKFISLTVRIDAVLVQISDGRVRWTGNVVANAADVAQGAITFSSNPKMNSCTYVVGSSPPTNKLFCMEEGGDRYRPCKGLRPDRRAVETLLPAAVNKLLGR